MAFHLELLCFLAIAVGAMLLLTSNSHVDGFHSYFVGETSVLVHDNSVITPPSVAFLGEKSVTNR